MPRQAHGPPGLLVLRAQGEVGHGARPGGPADLKDHATGPRGLAVQRQLFGQRRVLRTRGHVPPHHDAARPIAVHAQPVPPQQLAHATKHPHSSEAHHLTLKPVLRASKASRLARRQGLERLRQLRMGSHEVRSPLPHCRRGALRELRRQRGITLASRLRSTGRKRLRKGQDRPFHVRIRIETQGLRHF